MWRLYKAQKQEDKFLAMVPVLTAQQVQLLSAFYSISRERDSHDGVPKYIKEQMIFEYTERYGTSSYPLDLFVYAIKELDNTYLDLEYEKLKNRKNK